jgi:hypothetical protein
MAVTLWQNEHFGGVGLVSHDSVADLRNWNFNDKASAIQVTNQAAVMYEDVNFGGHHWTLNPGRYDLDDLHRLGIPNDTISSFVA